MMGSTGKTAVVTRGTTDIGFATGQMLAGCGALVGISEHDGADVMHATERLLAEALTVFRLAAERQSVTTYTSCRGGLLAKWGVISLD